MLDKDHPTKEQLDRKEQHKQIARYAHDLGEFLTTAGCPSALQPLAAGYFIAATIAAIALTVKGNSKEIAIEGLSLIVSSIVKDTHALVRLGDTDEELKRFKQK